MAALQIALCLLCLCAIAYYLLCLYSTHDFFRSSAISHQPSAISNFTPPVTVLKPARADDEHAYENFASFCLQDYPLYQVIFGVASPADPALPVIESIIAEHPDQHIQLVVADKAVGLHPKINKLNNMLPQAKYDLLIISDSDMQVDQNYLRHVVAPFADERVGVVTCPYRGKGAKNLASAFEGLYISADFMPSVFLANRLEGMSFAFGSTIAIRKSVLEAIGGFPSLADYYADDYQFGSRTRKAGYKVCLTPYVVDLVLPKCTFSQMLTIRLRWARSQRMCRPKGYAGLIFTHGFAFSLALLFISGFSLLGWLMAGGVLAVRLVTALLIAKRYLKDETLPRFFWLLPVNDLLSFLIWALSWCGSKITWRGKTFRLMQGGKMVRL